MTNVTDPARPAGADGASTGELVKLLSEQVIRLVRDELRLAQLELSSKGKRAGTGIGMLGGSGVLVLYAIGALLAAAIIGLAGVVAAWLAALIVAAALLASAGVAALLGKTQLKAARPPVPEQAVGSVKADVEEIKERAHR